MLTQALEITAARLPTFTVVQATDPADLDTQSRVSERFPAPSRMYKYRLQDPALWRARFDRSIFGLAIRRTDAILTSFAENRFATDIAIDGAADDYFGFAAMLAGRLTLFQTGQQASSTEGHGLAYRTGPGTRFLTGDDSRRATVFLKVADVTAALEHMLDARLRQPLAFRPDIDWSRGLAASLKGQFDIVLDEFRRSDGVADNAVALAAMTDLLAVLVLRAVPHTYTDQLERGSPGAVPAYVRRAEDFMRAHCAEPIRMADVAAAAGCSLRTLAAVFRQFRGTTSLGALHAIRLDQVHRDLEMVASDAPVAAIARRYGFTNASRFGTAFRRRFGESPSEVVRRAARS